jgi:hypothetical protein
VPFIVHHCFFAYLSIVPSRPVFVHIIYTLTHTHYITVPKGITLQKGESTLVGAVKSQHETVHTEAFRYSLRTGQQLEEDLFEDSADRDKAGGNSFLFAGSLETTGNDPKAVQQQKQSRGKHGSIMDGKKELISMYQYQSVISVSTPLFVVVCSYSFT